MNEQHDDTTNPLHLNTEPELQEIEYLLDAIGRADRASMPDQSNARVLEAVSGVFAPLPISIKQATQPVAFSSRVSPRWKLRIAAALVLVSGLTLGLVVLQTPLATNIHPEPGTNAWTLASFEQDLDAYLALEEVGDDSLDEAVANWELWAQTIDTDFDTELLGSGLSIGLTDLRDGAL